MKKKDKIALMVTEYYSNYPQLRDDIQHTQEVVSFTRLISVGEGMSEAEVEMLESAAWLHDIGCPKSKEIYGNSLPKNQMKLGYEVTTKLLERVDYFSESEKQWLANVVGTHHNFNSAVELNYLPLYEADLIVNILSGYHSIEKAPNLFNTVMKTKSGKELFKMLIKI